MTISLLHIVVPTILVLAILIIYINSRNKRVIKELGELKTQLEKLDNVPTTSAPVKEAQEHSVESTPPVNEEVGKKEEKDAPVEETSETEASAYNTGKSGKIYTKEELELLIKE